MAEKVIGRNVPDGTERVLPEGRTAYEAWARSLPQCVSYEGACDGNLVGLDHEPNCPMFGKEKPTFWDAWQAASRPVQQPAPALDINWENAGYEIRKKISGYQAEFGMASLPNNSEMGAIAERAVRVSSRAQQPATEPDCNNSESLTRWIWGQFVGCPVTEPYDAEYKQLFDRVEALQRKWFTKGLHEGVRQCIGKDPASPLAHSPEAKEER